MKKIILLVILISFNATSLLASDYAVNNVKVDVTADSATEARNQALDKARLNAFTILRDRIIPKDQQAGLPPLSSATVSTMVDSFEINREKLSKNRYLASVNVRFNQRAVQSYLGRYTNMAIGDEYYQTSSQANPSVSGTYNPHAQTVTDTPMTAGSPSPYQQMMQNRQMLANTTPFKMRVDLNNLRQWVSIQNTLQSIGNVRIESLKTSQAVVTLLFQGDASSLQNSLNMKGMQLYSNTAEYGSNVPYVLMVRG